MDAVSHWLLQSDEPWTRYRALRDLFDLPETDEAVQAARAGLMAHPRVQALLAEAAGWPGYAFARHNDAAYPIYKLSTLADFGLNAADPGLAPAIAAVLAHRSPEGALQSLVNVPRAFGGSGEDGWTWMVCDSPTLLYSLLAFGLGADERLRRALEHLAGLGGERGWGCVVAPELGRFRGPGRKGDPCPIANVFALKALALAPEWRDSAAVHAAAEMLLQHWAAAPGEKYYLFGVGSDYRKLKYPFVWYNVLHVADVLVRFPFVHGDPRLRQMLDWLAAQAGPDGRYTAGSMYQSWKGWSFSDKKTPSPWLTFLVLRILRRAGLD